MSESITLYKLMILHMLHRVNFPLTGAQFSDFFLTGNYANYFSLQQALSELTSSGLVHAESLASSTRYEITPEGEQTLNFFGSRISPEIMKDIDNFLNKNHIRMREEIGVISDFYRTNGWDYIVHCEVREGKSRLINLEVSVPDEEQASQMADHWKNRSQEIYAYVMRALMREDDKPKADS